MSFKRISSLHEAYLLINWTGRCIIPDHYDGCHTVDILYDISVTQLFFFKRCVLRRQC